MTMVFTAVHDGSVHEQETARLSDEAYRRAVLRSPEIPEDEADAILQREARHLGLQTGLKPNFYAASASSSTLDLRQNTRPTNYSTESFHARPLPPPPIQWHRSASTPAPPIPKRSSSLLKSFSRMTILRRKHTDKPKSVNRASFDYRLVDPLAKRSSESCFSAQARIDSWGPSGPPPERHADPPPSRPQTSASIRPQTAQNVHPVPSKEGLESCFSAQSKISSWSVSPTLTPSIIQDPAELEVPVFPELRQLQAQQLAERDRFLEYQRTSLRNLRLGMEHSRKVREDANAITMDEKRAKVILSIDFFNLG